MYSGNVRGRAMSPGAHPGASCALPPRGPPCDGLRPVATDASTLAGRYRLDAPEPDVGLYDTWRATDLTRDLPVRVERLPRPVTADLTEHLRSLRALSDVGLVPALDGGLEGDGAFMIFMAVVFCLVGLGVVWLRLGPFGRRLQAMKDSPAACATLGLNRTICSAPLTSTYRIRMSLDRLRLLPSSVTAWPAFADARPASAGVPLSATALIAVRLAV